MSTQPAPSRLYGLDLLRCLLMLIGPVFHVGFLFTVTQLDLHLPALKTVTFFAHPFRMGLFFFISGYFTQLVIEKKGIAAFTKNRKTTLFIPLVFSIVAIVPLTYWCYRLLDHQARFSFYHVWFLIALALLNAIIIFFPKSFKKLTEKCSSLRNRRLIFYYLLLCIVMRLLGPRLSALTSSGTRFSGELCMVFFYYPLKHFIHLVAGAIAYKKNLSMNVKGSAVIMASLLYILFYLVREAYPHEGSMSQRILATLIELPEFLASTALGLALFFYFKNLRINPNRLLSFVTKSSLAIYLVHQMFIFFFTRFFSGSLAAAMVVLFLTYLASFAIFWWMNRTPFTRALIGVRTVSRTNN